MLFPPCFFTSQYRVSIFPGGDSILITTLGPLSTKTLYNSQHFSWEFIGRLATPGPVLNSLMICVAEI